MSAELDLVELQKSDLVKALNLLYRSNEGSTFITPIYALLDQARFHQKAIQETGARKILEIGTHACGYAVLLKHLFPKAEFEIHTFGIERNSGECVARVNAEYGKPFVRFTLGDSSQTLARVSESFDLAWVDGGHNLVEATNDLENCHRLKIPNILVDDYHSTPEVRNAVNTFCDERKYVIYDRSEDGRCIVWLKPTSDPLAAEPRTKFL